MKNNRVSIDSAKNILVDYSKWWDLWKGNDSFLAKADRVSTHSYFIENGKNVELVVCLEGYTLSTYGQYISLAESSIPVYNISLRAIWQLSREQYILSA